MERDDDMQLPAPSKRTALVNPNDISDDEDVVFRSPAIAPMQLSSSAHSQPLRRRFFSTGANKQQRQVPVQPRQDLDRFVFAGIDEEFGGNRVQSSIPLTQPAMQTPLIQQIQNQSMTANTGQRKLVRSRKPALNPRSDMNQNQLMAMIQRGVEKDEYNKRQAQQEENDLNTEAIVNEIQTQIKQSATRVKNEQQVRQVLRPLEQPARKLERAFDYNKSQSKANFAQIKEIAADHQAVQKQIIQQAKQQSEAIAHKHSMADVTQKQYNSDAVTAVLANLAANLDWAVRDKALKELHKIFTSYPHLVLDLQPFFVHVPKLLLDLRSALVSQTLDTLAICYTAYANTQLVSPHQNALISLLKKAGSPAAAEFMAQSADQALVLGMANLYSASSYQVSYQQLFSGLQLELKPNAPPGVKFRIVYLFADLILLAYPDALSSLSYDTQTRYSLQWDESGLSCVTGQASNGNRQAASQRMQAHCKQLVGFLIAAVEKYWQDAHPEVRRATRRLYFVLHKSGFCEANKKIDEIIQREGVADTWWGR